MKKCLQVLLIVCAFLLLQPAGFARQATRTRQSRVVKFPVSGSVLVQAKEKVGHNPRMFLLNRQTGKVLLDYVFQDAEDVLKPQGDSPITDPFLRFGVIRAAGLPSPLLLAVGVSPGGSDHGFWAVIIGEVSGQLKVLTQELFTHIQGGFYLGYLNKKLGYGLVSWKFVWDDGAHYDLHPYEVEVFTLQGDRFVRRQKYVSKKKYEDNGIGAVRELGISVRDLRRSVPRLKEYLE